MRSPVPSYLTDWFAQLIATLLIGYVLLAPIWRITFENASRPVSEGIIIFLILCTLFPFWLLQGVALWIAAPQKAVHRWMMYLTTYLVGIGPLFALARAFAQKWRIKQAPLGLQQAGFFLIGLGVFVLLIQGYAVLVFGKLLFLILD